MYDSCSGARNSIPLAKAPDRTTHLTCRVCADYKLPKWHSLAALLRTCFRSDASIRGGTLQNVDVTGGLKLRFRSIRRLRQSGDFPYVVKEIFKTHETRPGHRRR
jgi:hypothetical protein